VANLYGGTILRVDLSKGKVSREPTSSYAADFLGCRGINIKILYDEVLPGIDPMSPANALIFGAGPLCGTPVPASRTEVTTKSPESGFLGSSNFGGSFAPELKFAGYDHIVFTGKADKPVYLWIYNDQVELRDASYLWGKDTFETQEIIRSQVDPEAKVACIGPAGEHCVHFATVQHGLKHGAGRTGTGGVMGSKNLKAVVVRGTKGVNLADPMKYLALATELEQKLRNDEGLAGWREHGMTFEQDTWWQQLHFQPEWQTSSHQTDLYLKYKPKRMGCFGCPTQCMDLYPPEAKGGGGASCTMYTGPLYELRNHDVDVLLEWILTCLRYGIDSVSSVGIVRWVMKLYERGILTEKDTDGLPMVWGSREAMLGMLRKIAYREGFGNILADGILPAVKRVSRGSEEYADHVKGIPQYTPYMRSNLIPLKARCLTIVTSSRGDSMRGLDGREIYPTTVQILEEQYGKDKAIAYEEALKQAARRITGTEKAANPDEYEGKARLVVYDEDLVTIADCTGACKFSTTHFEHPMTEQVQAELISVGAGIKMTAADLFNLARKVRNLERVFCVRDGMTRETDSLPKKYFDHPIEAGIFKGAVLESSKFEKMKDDYYALRGWDIATGIPTRETLGECGLGFAARDLEKMGKLPIKSSEKKSKK